MATVRNAVPMVVNMLTVRQAAAHLNVHPNTVRRWAEFGILTSYRVGPRGDRRFRRSDVDALLKVDGDGLARASEASPTPTTSSS